MSDTTKKYMWISGLLIVVGGIYAYLHAQAQTTASDAANATSVTDNSAVPDSGMGAALMQLGLSLPNTNLNTVAATSLNSVPVAASSDSGTINSLPTLLGNNPAPITQPVKVTTKPPLQNGPILHKIFNSFV